MRNTDKEIISNELCSCGTDTRVVFFFLEMEDFYRFKRVALPMHSGASEILVTPFFCTSVVSLSHFCLSKFCFFYQLEKKKKKTFFFVLAISELNFIPPPFAWNGHRRR